MASWENHINKRVALLKLSLATGNFTSFHVLAAGEANAPTTVADVPPEVADHIDNLNINTINAGKKDYKDFSADVESLKGQAPNTELWTTTINDAATKCKKKAVDAIEKVRLDALSYIRQFPESTRPPASHLFAIGLDAVGVFFDKLYGGLIVIGGAVTEFVKGTWTKLTDIWKIIQSTASACVHYIKCLHPLGTLSVKPIVLPASASLSQIQSHVESYLKQLSSNSTAASRLVVNKQSGGWEITALE
ncbi:hypothetical protein F4679DRAFT_592521 [Xylaria curta]|nr:hypothetical protein F4679DRAFT_592521 [Xylaria curta]